MLVVTGGAGFIGSVLAAHLNTTGRSDLVLVDDLGSAEKWRNIAKRDFHEILPIDGLLPWLEESAVKVEAIFHLGAISSTTATDADAVIARNLNYSIAVWRWCTRTKTRLIYASSAATYGDGSVGFDDRRDIAGLKRLKPLNLYGWSKHAFDVWAMREAAQGMSPPHWFGLKFFNVFGPNEYHKADMMSLIAKNYRDVSEGRPINLFKSHRPDYRDGEQRRDFIYVKDCIDVMSWLLSHDGESGIFNVGTGEARSFRELMEALAQACAKEVSIAYSDMPHAIRQNYQYFTEATVQKLRGSGYAAPFTKLEKAVEDYVTQYLSKDPYL